MAKYTFEFKRKVVQEYPDEKEDIVIYQRSIIFLKEMQQVITG